MIERFLKQTKFVSEEDFAQHLEFIVPEDFNFAYDVMDEWARIKPDAVALLWNNDKGEEKAYTYRDLRELSNRTASYFQSLGIGHGDVVMLILKRHSSGGLPCWHSASWEPSPCLPHTCSHARISYIATTVLR